MILDSLIRFHSYAPILQSGEKIAVFLATADLSNLPAGKTDIADTGAFAIASEYVPRPASACFLECHRECIDIQILIAGTEKIGFCPLDRCTTKEPYNKEKDFETVEGAPDFITLKPGYFALFFPNDAHMPGVLPDKLATRVKKIVIKVPANKVQPYQ
jgi:biofilm protein TabA